MTLGRPRDHRDPHAFVQRTTVSMCERCGACRRVDGSNERETCQAYLDRQRRLLDGDTVIRVHPELTPDAIKAQTARKVVHATGAATYRCDGCGRVDFWGSSWSWYGSVENHEDIGAEGLERVACSTACQDLVVPPEDPPPNPRRKRGRRS